MHFSSLNEFFFIQRVVSICKCKMSLAVAAAAQEHYISRLPWRTAKYAILRYPLGYMANREQILGNGSPETRPVTGRVRL